MHPGLLRAGCLSSDFSFPIPAVCCPTHYPFLRLGIIPMEKEVLESLTKLRLIEEQIGITASSSNSEDTQHDNSFVFSERVIFSEIQQLKNVRVSSVCDE